MAETSKPQSPTSSTEMHWGVAYLRQDIQDLRQDLRQDIQDLRQDMRQDIQDLRQDMRHQVGILHGRVDETNRRIDSRFALLVTAMIAMTGVLLAAIKL